jgi:hypothetical protein
MQAITIKNNMTIDNTSFYIVVETLSKNESEQLKHSIKQEFYPVIRDKEFKVNIPYDAHKIPSQLNITEQSVVKFDGLIITNEKDIKNLIDMLKELKKKF